MSFCASTVPAQLGYRPLSEQACVELYNIETKIKYIFLYREGRERKRKERNFFLLVRDKELGRAEMKKKRRDESLFNKKNAEQRKIYGYIYIYLFVCVQT